LETGEFIRFSEVESIGTKIDFFEPVNPDKYGVYEYVAQCYLEAKSGAHFSFIHKSIYSKDLLCRRDVEKYKEAFTWIADRAFKYILLTYNSVINMSVLVDGLREKYNCPHIREIISRDGKISRDQEMDAIMSEYGQMILKSFYNMQGDR